MLEKKLGISKIQDIIASSDTLALMPKDSHFLARLDQGIKSILHGQLADHCQIGTIENDTLIYYVDSPVWAYTFKMSTTSILATLHQLATQYSESKSDINWKQLLEIKDIRIRVRPSITRPKKFSKPRKPLPKFSKSIGLCIEQAADTFEDPELAQLWRDFARIHSL